MTGTRDPIIVALDIGERERLLRVARGLRGQVETVKVGLEAYANMGPEVVEELVDMGYRVFADLMLHDIPNTVHGAVMSLVRQGAHMLTVHASGGRSMLAAAVEAAGLAAEAMGEDAPLVLGVTVLTSLDDAAVAEIGWIGDAEETVLSLARLGMECGLAGVVASAREAAAIRSHLGRQAVIVTPGIRLENAGAQDQARTATPAEALAAGADYLVVGRPVISAPDPLAALQTIRKAAGL